MTSASILQFPSRGPAMLDREPLPTNLRRSRAGAVSFTSQEHMGQNSNPARKSIVIRWTAPATSESCAAICCNLAGLYPSRGFQAEIKNFCRSLTGWSIRALLNSSQEPSRRVSKSFKAFRGFVLGHAKQLTHGELYCQTIPLKDRTRCL